MVTCTFCGNNFENKGKMFVKKSGKILYFCSSKCDKNLTLGRKARDTKWTKIHHDEKKKNKKWSGEMLNGKYDWTCTKCYEKS